MRTTMEVGPGASETLPVSFYDPCPENSQDMGSPPFLAAFVSASFPKNMPYARWPRESVSVNRPQGGLGK